MTESDSMTGKRPLRPDHDEEICIISQKDSHGYYIDLLMAVFTASALCLNMEIPKLDNWQRQDVITEISWNIKYSISGKGILAIMAAAACFMAYKKLYKNHRLNVGWAVDLCNIMLSAIWLLAESFRIDNSLNVLYASPGQIIKSFIYILGVFWGLEGCSLYFADISLNDKKCRLNAFLQKAKQVFDMHPTRNGALAILLLWLPHIIIAFPGYFCQDSFKQLAQYYNLIEWSSHHPPISTLLMGIVVQIGSVINGSFGLYLYILLQAGLAAIVLAYGAELMKQLKAPIWITTITVLSIVFVPYYSAYIGVFLKDNIYSYFFLLFIIELIWMLNACKKFFNSKRHLFLWSISGLGVIVFRNNGIFIIGPVLSILFIRQLGIYLKNRHSYKALVKHLFLLILPLLLAITMNGIVNSYFKVEKGSIREALSLPIQQTARYVKKYNSELTSEEIEKLQQVLPVDKLSVAYNPRISDPVKNLFKYYPTHKELGDYLYIWAVQFLKHPLVYVEATLNQNYYCFYPLIPNDMCFVNTLSNHNEWIKYDEIKSNLKLSSTPVLDPWKNRIYAYYMMWFELPIFNLLAHPAFYNIMLVWVILFSLKRRLYRAFLAALPLLLSLIIIIFAPVIQGHPRYAFPIVFSMPLVLSYYLYSDSMK